MVPFSETFDLHNEFRGVGGSVGILDLAVGYGDVWVEGVGLEVVGRVVEGVGLEVVGRVVEGVGLEVSWVVEHVGGGAGGGGATHPLHRGYLAGV